MANDVAASIAASVAPLRAQLGNGSPLPAAAYDGPETSSGGFLQRMHEAVQSVNQQDHDAGQRMAAVDSGQSDDLVGAMLASQQASLSFSMLMQVRNKVVTAVEDLVKLPI